MSGKSPRPAPTPDQGETIIVQGRGILVACLLTIAAAFPAGAQDDTGPGTVLAVVTPGPAADRSLQGIISDAVQVQLIRRNAIVRFADPGLPDPVTLEGGLALAAAEGCRYLLVCRYETDNRKLTLRAELYETATSTRAGIAEADGPVDLTLDDVVARALAGALAGISFPPPAVGAAPDPGDAAAAAASPEALPAEPPQPVVQPGDIPAGRQRRFEISAGAAPLIPTGAAADYIDIGLLATVSFDLRFPLGAGTLGAGILSGACLFNASGVVSDAFVLLVPLGLDLQYSFGRSGPGVILHLSGGAALMSTSAPAIPTLLKIVPYALAGIALDVPFSPALGITAEASYAVFFESATLPIMAFAPEVSLYVRF